MPAQVINTRYELIETEAHPEASPFVVSKARDTAQGRVVSLQVLPAERIAGAPERDSFLAAVSEAMRLDHPSIIRVFDRGEIAATGDLYVAGEYVRGITLQERIRRVAPFTLTVTADIAVAVTEALESAHRDGVVHGDLRPRSVLLSPEGQIKVGEFRYARAVAPEMRGQAPPSVGGDIAAVGALLYEMLTGTPPRHGAASSSPRTDKNGVPPALDGIVQKALHPDPAVRYPSAGSLLSDLRAFRDALHKGRPLTWSPLTDKRPPRPVAAETAAPFPRPVEADGEAGAGRADTAGAGRRPRAALLTEPAVDRPEEDRYVSSERERSSPLGKILLAAFLLVAVGVAALVWCCSQFFAIPNDVQVPTLIGKTMDEAKQVAAQQHFTLVEANSDYSTKWPENQIYLQDPPAGRTIKAGKEVNVYRSLGPRLLKVPRLVGETRDRALGDLQDVGLPEGTVTEEYSETIQKGVVLRQSPDAGSAEQPVMVARNTALNFVVSKGRQPPDPPGDPAAEASAPDTVALHWDAAPRAESYTVYRLLDGNTTTVAKGLVDTHLTDRNLQPDTTYSYTVDAVNSAGASGGSEPAVVTTPAKPVATPVLPPGTVVTPGGGPASPMPSLGDADTTPAPAPSGPPPSAKMRQFTVAFRVPRHPRKSRRVQFEVQDVTGTNLVYDETHDAGDEISAPVQGFGNKITIRIFIDGGLVKQQTL